MPVTLRFRPEAIDYDPTAPRCVSGVPIFGVRARQAGSAPHDRAGPGEGVHPDERGAEREEEEAVGGGGGSRGGGAGAPSTPPNPSSSSLLPASSPSPRRLGQAGPRPPPPGHQPGRHRRPRCFTDNGGASDSGACRRRDDDAGGQDRGVAPAEVGQGGVGAANAHPKALASFFDKVVASCSRKVDFGVVKCFVVAGPGFTKDAFKKHLEGLLSGSPVSSSAEPLPPETATPASFAAAALQRLVLSHASCAYKHALREVLASKAVAAQICDTSAAREAAALGALFDTLAREPSRAFYGPGHVAAAAELGAIKTLMLSDSLFRVTTGGGGGEKGSSASSSAVDVIKRRAGWEALAENVRSAGGEVLVFSAAHSTGAALDKITGCAALLRFPAPQLEDLELEDEVGRK